MNAILATLCEVVLLLFVPAALTVRFLAPERLSWRTLILVVAAASWVLSMLIVYFNHAYKTDLVMQAGGFDSAPQDLRDDWANDGGPKTFALLFGWLPGLALMVPCLAIYGVAHIGRRHGAQLSG